jgi:CelD/BcsL family acetyltransferase involved in cellulose biosynthesis
MLMATVASGMRVRVIEGPGLLEEIGPALDALHASTSCPITFRRPWLQNWAISMTDFEPWGILVEGKGRIEAAALLARRRRLGMLHIVGLGHAMSDLCRFPAVSPESASMLAQCIVRQLRATPGPWWLRVEQLPVNDPVADAIARMFPSAALTPGDPCPVVRFDRGRSLSAYVSPKNRQNSRTRMNRLHRAGKMVTFAHVRDPGEVAAHLPAMERIRRERDHSLLRPSNLEDPRFAAFWRRTILGLARRGEMELTVLSVQGELIAYVVGLLDGSSYRTWDTRFSPDWNKFSPGRLANEAALQSALADDRFNEFDWMRGAEQYKLAFATHGVPSEHLVAWSSSISRAGFEAARRMKGAAKDIRDRHQWLQIAWLALRTRSIHPMQKGSSQATPTPRRFT